jgi:hypothetical protein
VERSGEPILGEVLSLHAGSFSSHPISGIANRISCHQIKRGISEGAIFSKHHAAVI